MTNALVEVSDGDLLGLAAALRSRRLSEPYSPAGVGRLVSLRTAAAVAAAFELLRSDGAGPEAIATALDILRADRAGRPSLDRGLELVTTGPDVFAQPTRDTAVVVRELFANAEKSVLLAGYAVYQGQKVFQALADRMRALPALRVRLFLDIQRPHGDPLPTEAAVARFGQRFVEFEWPKDGPLPEVFYDPRSLETEPGKRACLHAKVVVVDDSEVFITSANFTEAAQQRNIEVGVSFHSRTVGAQLQQFFDDLLSQGALSELKLG